jgi:hypothetical protein
MMKWGATMAALANAHDNAFWPEKSDDWQCACRLDNIQVAAVLHAPWLSRSTALDWQLHLVFLHVLSSFKTPCFEDHLV